MNSQGKGTEEGGNEAGKEQEAGGEEDGEELLHWPPLQTQDQPHPGVVGCLDQTAAGDDQLCLLTSIWLHLHWSFC